MSMHWCWSWGIGLPLAQYNAGSAGWVTSGTNITTNNTTGLIGPAPGGVGPTDTHNIRLSNSNIRCPNFPDGALQHGWTIIRWNGEKSSLTASAAVRIIELMNGTTVVVNLRAAVTGVAPPLALYVNGTLVGTTSKTYGTGTNTLAIDVDLSTTPPKAGLVVDGYREITLSAGSGAATSFNNIRWGSGTSSSSLFATMTGAIVFDSISDLTDRQTQDVWVTYMIPDSVTDGDNSWTPILTSDLADVSDKNVTTGITSVTNPDTVSATIQNLTDRQSGWAPTVIYGAAAIGYALGDVTINKHVISLTDGGGTAKTSGTYTVPVAGEFVGVWSALASDAAAWEAADINSAGLTYTVST